ncbi:hypothetical protein D5S17_01125 [Pseudonocardiaceae bacterium YIM PH 21723]|nr:hypothetical protein D5S17_01125 [Pseudonocardiaceae bacterium YIM PH 21723]
MMIRRALLAALLLLGIAAPGAQAAANPLTFAVDKTQAVRGDTVTFTVTFTNPEATDVYFSYLSVNPNWATANAGLKYNFTGCTGEVNWCSVVGPESRGGALHYGIPIPAGASRTATLSYQVAADSACGPGKDVGFYFYTYRETSTGPADAVVPGPVTAINC